MPSAATPPSRRCGPSSTTCLPCLVTVGTADWLLDDNLFLAARLAAAGNDVDLAVWPAGPHGIESSPTALGRLARQRIYEFLTRCLDEAPTRR